MAEEHYVPRRGTSPERQRAPRPSLERAGTERRDTTEQVKQKAEEAQEQVKQKAEQAQERARGVGQRVRRRASGALESQKERVANRIDDVGQRVEDRGRSLQQQGGMKAKAGEFTHRAGERIERSADYLRTNRLSTIRDDAKDQIREHPFASVGAALGSGVALGWMLHGGAEPEEREPHVERGREEEGRGAVGRLGRALLTGATAMAARRVRERASRRRER